MTTKRMIDKLTKYWPTVTSYHIAKEIGTTPYIVDTWREKVPGKPPVKGLSSRWLKKIISHSETKLADSEVVQILLDEG